MTTESQAASESASGLAGASSRPLLARENRWRLPISYGSIASTALGLDLALILGSAIFAETIYHQAGPDAFEGEYSHTLAAAVFIAILFVAAMRVQKLYSPTRLTMWDDQARSVLAAWCGAFLILASGVFSWGVSHDLSRGDVLLFWATGVVVLLAHRAAWRFALPRALESGALRGRTIVSLTWEDNVPPEFTENLTSHGYHAVAHFQMPDDTTAADQIIERVISLCRTSDIQEVMLFVDPERMSNVRWVARRLRVLPLPVTLVPFGTLALLFQRARSDIGDTVAIELQRAALSPVEQAIKRTVDIVLSLLGLLVLSPILLAIALAIRLDSAGPALFRQTRHGFNGRPFRIYKFRTMTVMENGDVIQQAQKADKRVTRVGKWLRRFSIDELPQLLNVFLGDMSLVGPRPHASAHEKHFTSAIEKYAFRHHVKSGVTGWAQVHGARGETDTLDKMQRRVELDIWYINNWSIWLDFSVMIRTVLVVFTSDNAH
jgi:putative colanic acid biosysnthesis UDP-glucose lipid carrier transferase